MGAVLSATDIHDRGNFDVVMSFMNSLNNTPESNIWYELSQQYNLRYLQLPDDLLESMAKASGWEVGPTPVRLLRGMDTPIETIRTSGTVIFGRADLPDQFAYDVAKSLDEQKHVLVFSILPFSSIRPKCGRLAAFPYTRARNATTAKRATCQKRVTSRVDFLTKIDGSQNLIPPWLCSVTPQGTMFNLCLKRIS